MAQALGVQFFDKKHQIVRYQWWRGFDESGLYRSTTHLDRAITNCCD